MELEQARQYVADMQKEQEYERRRHRPTANDNMESEAKSMIRVWTFWCDDCQEDFRGLAFKTSHQLFGATIAVYRCQCPYCDKWAVRHITHRDEDFYFYKSSKIRKDRNMFKNDMLQPDDLGFRNCYGRPDLVEENRRVSAACRRYEAELDKGFHPVI